jgi:hypothetical protein
MTTKHQMIRRSAAFLAHEVPAGTKPSLSIVCFLPVGADDSILDSAGPPESDAPPHVSQGMFAELVVT